jgi:hypothetical protein
VLEVEIGVLVLAAHVPRVHRTVRAGVAWIDGLGLGLGLGLGSEALHFQRGDDR